MKTFFITTLGCKVNQCESTAIAGLMEHNGFALVDNEQSADICIINTCTVTGKSAMQSRQAIRQAVRQHPDAVIAVTGCYAQTAPAEIEAINGVDLIIGHHGKLQLPEILRKNIEKYPHTPVVICSNVSTLRTFHPLPLSDLSGTAWRQRTRAFLKIQDGCNTCCTYCIVPRARGRSRSMPMADVFMHLDHLGISRFREVVLSGIHLGAYGIDLKPATSLTQLLKKIHALGPVERIRLSSIEPTEVDSPLIELMAIADTSKGRLCPHWHIPLQSGDNGILRRMGRPYTQEQFSDVIHTIRQHLPLAAIGTDVLVGFPGETSAAHQQTYSLIESLPLTYLHVFPYSQRQGTPAAAFTDKVPERVVKERCRRLRALGKEKRMTFFRSLIGNTVEVLIETLNDPHTGWAKGISDNYLPVVLDSDEINKNDLVQVRIESIGSDGLVMGKLVQ